MTIPVVMYGCESWTVKKAERRRIDAIELRCWRRLLRVPWTARRSNQSILKEISPEISLEGMMLKLKLQYFGHLMQRVDSLENESVCITTNCGKFLKRWEYQTTWPASSFMAAVTICSDFGAQKNSQPLFPLFPHLFPMK